MKLPYGDLSSEEFEKFRVLVYQQSGIRIAPGKQVMVANRLRRRLRETGAESFSAYYDLLTSMNGASELPRFLDEITTHETYFYRDKVHFEWFGKELIPELVRLARAGKRSRRLRVWSAACSTGEELYSLGIQLLGQKSQLAGWDVTMLGTDLSGASLAAARAGRYEARAVRLVPKGELQSYFDHDSEGGTWTVKPELRELATWKQHNLMRKLDTEPFDCIFLKNVLIYFDEASKRAVARNLMAALAPGGYLVVGLTEGVHAMLGGLQKRSAWLFQQGENESTDRGSR
jgi:chemotaxis protein methyltransferase CheR